MIGGEVRSESIRYKLCQVTFIQRVVDLLVAGVDLAIVDIHVTRLVLHLSAWHKLIEFLRLCTISKSFRLLEGDEDVLGEGWVLRVQIDRVC